MADLVTRLLLNSSNFDNNIVKSTQQIKQFQQIGNKASSCMSTFGSTLTKTIMPMASIAGTAMLVSKGFNEAIKTSIEFEKSLSSLRSLTGVTTQELSYFKDEAIRLGSTTTQSASQVADAFKLIGSQMPQLLKSKEMLTQVTEQAIVLAEAAGIDVPTASKALTGALNQMGDGASKAGTYINILAAASQQGAADIPYLNSAIENAGGTASSVGINFNELVAAIEAIAPKFSDAGAAGTYLRNIFLNLESSSDKNLKPSVVGLSKALENLAAKNMDATQLTKKFGKINVTAAMAIINARGEYNKLSKSIEGTNTAYEQAKINTDNVAGSIDMLKSSWEGFTLSLNKSNGTLKHTLDFITSIVDSWRSAIGGKEQYYKEEQQKEYKANSVAASSKLDELSAKGYSPSDAYKHVTSKSYLLGYSGYNDAEAKDRVKQYHQLQSLRAQAKNNGNDAVVGNYDSLIIDLTNNIKLDNQNRRAYNAFIKGAKDWLASKNVKPNASSGDSGNGSGTKKDKELSPEQSIAYYQQELTKANKEFNSAVSDSARAAVQQKIDELKEVIRVMEFKANHTSLPGLIGENGNMSGHTSLKVNSNPTAGLNVKGIDVSRSINKNVTATDNWIESLNLVAQTLGNVQNATNGNAIAWVGFFGNVMTSTAGMITAINALNAANAAEQASASGAAVAEATKSAAQTPLIGWLMVGAAAASCIATLMSIPKFATGGIVGGNSFSGDNILARVNSGEMILNKQQQGTLYNVLSDNNRSNIGRVVFDIRGDKLSGVLHNYNASMSKIR